MGLRIALVGKRANPKTMASFHLFRRRKFKRMRLDDGVTNLVRKMYTYKLHKRVKWEKRLEIYDALYKIDPSMHIDYLLRKLMTTTTDVVVPDVRYMNEVDKLVQAGFILIRVTTTIDKPMHLKGIKHSGGALVQLQEWFGHDFDNYPVSYSISADDRDKMNQMLDIIVEKERAKVVDIN